MSKAWIDGAPAPFADALSVAALRLADSRLPLVTGLATDVAGVRAALRLAEAAGGVLDHSRSAVLYRDLDVLRRTGLFRGVPAELRRRVDRVLLVGSDAFEVAPDLLGFLLGGAPDLGRGAGAGRQAVWLGGFAEALRPEALAEVSIDAVPMADAAIAGFVGMMRASLGGRRFDRGAPGADRAADLAAWLAEARFAAVVWSARALDPIAIETLGALTAELNAGTRASAVPLGEAGEAHGAAEVATWLSGYPLRTSFARGEAEHDPHLFAAERLLASGECDLAVVVDAREGVRLGQPGAAGVSTIAIGDFAQGAPPSSGVAFDVHPAGAAAAGALWDGRLASFVSQAAGGAFERPSAAKVLTALGEALGEARSRAEPAGRAA